MPILFAFGRVIFVAYFVFAALQRLINVAGSADLFAQKFVMPAALTGVMVQIESAIGLSAPQLIALLSGAIELAAALLIAFNVGTRAMALILIVIVAAEIYYDSNFWNLTDGLREAALYQAMLHVSLIGGLILFVALGSRRPGGTYRPV